MKSNFKGTIKNLSWVGAFRIFNRLIIFFKTAILARLLNPVQFGIFGIAGLILALLEVFTETGINVFLVQHKSDINKYINTAWIVSIIRGIIVSLIIIITAPFISRFFNAKDSYGVLLVISIVPFIRGFINPAVAKLQKKLLFKTEFWYKLAILFVDTITSVIFSLLTHSAYSIAYGLIAGVIMELILSFVVVKPKPFFKINTNKLKEIIKKGKWITAYGIFSYLFQNGDNMIVGKLLGEASLGIYSVAYKISSLPVSEIAEVFSRVTFPMYVRMVKNPTNLKKVYFKILYISSLLMILAGLGIYLFAKPLVLIVLGSNWLDAVHIIKILSIFGIIKGISTQSQAILFSLERQKHVAVITLIGLLGLFIPIIPLTLKYGLNGTAFSVIIGSLVTIPFTIYYINHSFSKLKLSNI